MRRLAPLLSAALGLLALAGCTGGSSAAATSTSPASPAQTLATAKQALDAAPAVHFTLTSPTAPTGAGTALLGGEGDLVRPDRFKGELDVVVNGLKAHIGVVSLAGTVYVQFLGSAWSVVKPEQVGLRDPAALMAPQGGLADLLTSAQNPTFAGEKRRGSEVLRQVGATLPGTVVARVLTSVDPAAPVRATFGVDEATGQLREATLTGPFLSASSPSTYTVVLDKYGEKVDVRAPTA